MTAETRIENSAMKAVSPQYHTSHKSFRSRAVDMSSDGQPVIYWLEADQDEKGRWTLSTCTLFGSENTQMQRKEKQSFSPLSLFNAVEKCAEFEVARRETDRKLYKGEYKIIGQDKPSPHYVEVATSAGIEIDPRGLPVDPLAKPKPPQPQNRNGLQKLQYAMEALKVLEAVTQEPEKANQARRNFLEKCINDVAPQAGDAESYRMLRRIACQEYFNLNMRDLADRLFQTLIENHPDKHAESMEATAMWVENPKTISAGFACARHILLKSGNENMAVKALDRLKALKRITEDLPGLVLRGDIQAISDVWSENYEKKVQGNWRSLAETILNVHPGLAPEIIKATSKYPEPEGFFAVNKALAVNPDLAAQAIAFAQTKPREHRNDILVTVKKALNAKPTPGIAHMAAKRIREMVENHPRTPEAKLHECATEIQAVLDLALEIYAAAPAPPVKSGELLVPERTVAFSGAFSRFLSRIFRQNAQGQSIPAPAHLPSTPDTIDEIIDTATNMSFWGRETQQHFIGEKSRNNWFKFDLNLFTQALEVQKTGINIICAVMDRYPDRASDVIKMVEARAVYVKKYNEKHDDYNTIIPGNVLTLSSELAVLKHALKAAPEKSLKASQNTVLRCGNRIYKANERYHGFISDFFYNLQVSGDVKPNLYKKHINDLSENLNSLKAAIQQTCENYLSPDAAAFIDLPEKPQIVLER